MGKGGEQQEMARQMARVRQVRKVMTRAVGRGGAGQGAGQRPVAKDGETKEVERRERLELHKGKMSVIDTVPGKGFKGPFKPDEAREEIRQAAQQAPAAIDRERLPASAKKMARDYFEKVRGPEKDKKP